ncbi:MULTISPECIES: hypothetical protein [Moorena]|nr:hypothetical protein [Moorena sp. SIO4G3]NEO76548.1 hypothetical protein [Moorena sp. SIO4G3]
MSKREYFLKVRISKSEPLLLQSYADFFWLVDVPGGKGIHSLAYPKIA